RIDLPERLDGDVEGAAGDLAQIARAGQRLHQVERRSAQDAVAIEPRPRRIRPVEAEDRFEPRDLHLGEVEHARCPRGIGMPYLDAGETAQRQAAPGRRRRFGGQQFAHAPAGEAAGRGGGGDAQKASPATGESHGALAQSAAPAASAACAAAKSTILPPCAATKAAAASCLPKGTASAPPMPPSRSLSMT